MALVSGGLVTFAAVSRFLKSYAVESVGIRRFLRHFHRLSRIFSC